MTASSPPPADDKVREVLASVCDELPWDAGSDTIVDALLPAVSALVDKARADGAADELDSMADWNDERPEMRVSRGSIAAVLRNQADRIRAAIRQTEGNNR